MSQLVTARHIAFAAKVSPGTVHQWARCGLLTRVGGKAGWLFPEDQIEKAMRLRGCKPQKVDQGKLPNGVEQLRPGLFRVTCRGLLPMNLERAAQGALDCIPARLRKGRPRILEWGRVSPKEWWFIIEFSRTA